MKIELIHPPDFAAMEDRLDAPLGLLYIAAELQHYGYTVRINDLSGIPESKWKVEYADIYGITMYVPSIPTCEKIACLCRKVNSSCKIVVGGAHPTSAPQSIGKEFDIVVIGEGELAFLKILQDYPNNKKYYEIPLERDLDLYPNPAYNLVDLNSYKRIIDGKKSVSTLASRGCPYRCAFCGLSKCHQVVKYRSPEQVASEIKELKEEKGIEAFNFQDDTFTLNKKRLYKFLDLLKPLNIKFRCHGRAGNDKKEDYIRLKEAGCSVIGWGIESGSQHILDKMNKKVTVEENIKVIQWAKELGITSRTFFIFGFPGENKETLKETKAFIERADPDQYFISNFVPYPSTDVWKYPKKYGIIKLSKDFSQYYQVDKSGFGGMSIETEWLKDRQFRELERDFREWIAKRKRRGQLQEYEKMLEAKK